MTITPQRVVTLHYVLHDADGRVLDDSRARQQPLEYLHGHHNIVAGLERALEGQAAAAELSVTLPQRRPTATATRRWFGMWRAMPFPSNGYRPACASRHLAMTGRRSSPWWRYTKTA